jgi:hypothetical protein
MRPSVHEPHGQIDQKQQEQNANIVRRLYDSGITPTMVQKNPGLVSILPFVEDIWSGLANVDFPGSASAIYFDCVCSGYGGSFLDFLQRRGSQYHQLLNEW